LGSATVENIMVNGHQPPAPAAPNDYAADAAAAADVDTMPPPPPTVAPTAPSLAYHDAALVVDSPTVAASDAAVSHRPPQLPPSVLPAAVVEGMMIPEEEPLNVVIQPVQQQQKSTTTTTAKSKTPPPSPKRQAHFQQLPHEEPQQHQKLKQPKLLKKPQDLQPDRPISLNLRQRMMSMNSTHSLNMEAMEAAVDNSSVEDHHLHDNLSIKPKRHAHNVSDISFPEAVSESSAATTTTTGPAAAPVLVAPLSPRLEKEEQAEEVKPVIVSLPSSLPPLRPPPPPTVTVPLHCSIQQQHQQQRQFSADSRIRLGICAMDKKARSRPMTQILSRLDDAFEVVFFGDDLILNHDITEWPLCDVVIAFFSKGYPLAKAKEYVALRQPFILNDLEKQELLQDRRKVYDLLEASGIDVPRHVYLSRDGYVSTGTGDGNGAGDTEVQEFDDHVIVNGMQIHKPFVEKPVNAEDHNLAIYYPTTAGGGCKKLFRKIGNRSSEFYPNINEVRRDGSYIYEEFVETQGTDVKMYTVGPEYGHAEARKSPTIDGKVERNSDGTYFSLRSC
jgi:Diphosphoinositol pentakisphosphate kinase 2 N-terminal domain